MTTNKKVYKENIVLNLNASTKIEVVEKLAERLFKNGFIDNLAEFIKDVKDREEHMTTGIGNGIAIPHGKSSSVLESTVIFAKTTEDIEWESLDDKPVNIIFLLAISKQDAGDKHLRILADISGKLMDDDFVYAIKKAGTEKEIEELLSKV
ncbi:PTS system mannose-specific EIIBCA component [Carnobacterium sp. 17-4]|uniref:PTS sugar transporter subunit IIA n=1 Tax=Carnobacterium sp. (strain 17-4) TaxID=208596 RepID=UPI0002059362|nr:fructose PTS transporter subunit IIA [Carnobacterium sp. 17-4]AEB30998.1 PTS system mannose-specific EIIBCA component [Carnobacterium sp. 17-4]